MVIETSAPAAVAIYVIKIQVFFSVVVVNIPRAVWFYFEYSYFSH